MKEIRVLVLSNLYPRADNLISGGFIHLQVANLIREQCQIEVISPVPYVPIGLRSRPRWKYHATPVRDTVDGISVSYPRYLRAPGKWFHVISGYALFASTAHYVTSVVREFQPHVIHSHFATPNGFAGLFLRRKYNLPLVCTLHGSDINFLQAKKTGYGVLALKQTCRVLMEADQIVAVSQALRAAAEAIAKPEHDIQVAYLGCDIEEFIDSEEARFDVRAALGISPREVVLLFVGRLVETKGIFDLVDAFAKLHSPEGHLSLIFVGDGSARRELTRRVVTLGLGGKVHIVGKRAHEEISRWLSASDIFVLPSHGEGLPSVVLEAMACQRPVIATRVGGIPEAIQDRKSGFLIEKGDIATLANTIADLAKDENKRHSMGIYGRTVVSREFTWKRSARRLRQVYDDVLTRRIEKE